MLKQRILTALILIPIVVFLILKLSSLAFAFLTAIFIGFAAWEWSGLMGIKKFPKTLIYPILIAGLLYGSCYLPITIVMYLASAWWLFATLLIILYPKCSDCWSKCNITRGFMGVMVLIPAWLAINFLHQQFHGPYAVLYLFILIWGADSGAYFIGKKWGKHKLAPLVSPGKTWQGAFGAIITTIIIASIALTLLKAPLLIWPAAITLSITVVIFSIIGDLFESMLKRKAGLKDSGNIFPGHGGILDRIDSLTAAAPIFVTGALLLR
jgi:phosphatidate cytidylyltransferase